MKVSTICFILCFISSLSLHAQFEVAKTEKGFVIANSNTVAKDSSQVIESLVSAVFNNWNKIAEYNDRAIQLQAELNAIAAVVPKIMQENTQLDTTLQAFTQKNYTTLVGQSLAQYFSGSYQMDVITFENNKPDTSTVAFKIDINGKANIAGKTAEIVPLATRVFVMNQFFKTPAFFLEHKGVYVYSDETQRIEIKKVM